MKKITILFGNGLGRAISEQANNAYQLKSGLQSVYDKLEDNDKKNIHNKNKPIEDEDELEHSHFLATYISEILKIQNVDNPMITSQGMEFPEKRLQYIFDVAKYFYELENTFPENFINSLTNLIRTHQTNIATLNFDSLLYKSLFNKDLLKPIYSETRLVDGFQSKGFHEDNLERRADHYFGWYLHLHGSPLFYTGTDQHYHKSSIIETLNNDLEHRRNHVVLDHTKAKPDIIANSSILRSYWDYFSHALRESEIIILMGFSGKDMHVNKAVKMAFNNNKNKILKIISHESDTKEFWMNCFPFLEEENVILLPNILSYDFANV